MRLRTGVLAAFAALAPAGSLAAQKKPVTQPLVVSAVAGQQVALVPLSLAVVDPSVEPGLITLARPALLRWADSLLLDGAQSRAPEVTWVPPADLRRVARRGAGLLADPDQMGQSVLRSWGLQMVPDPLRSNLRKLLAVAGGLRYAMVPASLVFKSDSTGALAAELSIVLADVRSGRVVWRSVAKGREGTPEQVLGKAIATVFPVEDNQP